MKKSFFAGWVSFYIGSIGLLIPVSVSYAEGVFNLTRFVSPGKFAIGLQPELGLTPHASMGVQLRYTQGISDLSNAVGIIGTGGGERQFEAGGALTFDLFPDAESQPGLGFAVQGIYVQMPTGGSVETSGIPYLHKTFRLEQGQMIEPFLAVPVGLTLARGRYNVVTAVTLGSFFQHTEHLSSVVEFGIGLQNSDTTLSGGLVYYY